jgi:hypothetical protein
LHQAWGSIDVYAIIIVRLEPTQAKTGFGRGTPKAMALDERDFYEEKEQKKPATLNCPHCKQSAEYELSWLVRTKKKQLPPRADERDRAKYAKARSYMVRKDDLVMCKNMRCRKRIEVSGVQSVAFLD